MKTAGFLLLLAALPAAAQMAGRAVTPAAPATPTPTSAPVAAVPARISLDALRNLERAFDAKLESCQPDPINMMGATRGLYLPGYGLVLTAELDLTLTPTAGGLLRRVVSPAEASAIHQKKLAQVPVVQKLMRELLATAARQADIPDNERVVLAIRLWFQAYEDRSGLPSQLMVSADRKSALSGQVVEVASR